MILVQNLKNGVDRVTIIGNKERYRENTYQKQDVIWCMALQDMEMVFGYRAKRPNGNIIIMLSINK